jgi:Tol biopolymer transport system component
VLEPPHPSVTRRLVAAAVSLTVAAVGFSFAFAAFGDHQADRERAAAPIGSKIALTIGDPGRLAVVDPDGTDLRMLTTGKEPDAYVDKFGYADDSSPTWSPDGTTIAFTRWYDGATSLCMIDSDGTNFRVVVRDFQGGQIAWSPDGATLAYYRGRDETIHLMDADGANNHPLAALPEVPSGDPPTWLPAWSPDGTRIAFTSRDLWTIGAGGTGLTQLTHLPEDQAAFDASWSPDGSRVAFSLGRWLTDGVGGAQTGGDVYVVNADGSNLTSLTGTDRSEALPSPPLDGAGQRSGQGGWTKPSWSPDGTQIALMGASLDFGHQGVYVMNADGTELHQILDVSDKGGGSPAWHLTPPEPLSSGPWCSWSTAPSPNQDPSTYFNFLRKVAAVSDHDVWAVGTFYVNEEGGHEGSLILHWTGTRWTVVPHPAQESVLLDITAVSSDDVWAVGLSEPGPQGLIEHWDGTQWSVVPSADPGTRFWHFEGVAAVGPDDVWAVGNTATGESGGTLIEHWDGSAWSVVPSPSPEPRPLTGRPYGTLDAVAALSADDVWAVGEATNVAGVGASNTLIEHWDGSAWSVVPSPDEVSEKGVPFDHLLSVAANSPDDVWAVGIHGNDAGIGGGGDHGLIEHWDGNSWQVVEEPVVGVWNRFYGVSASSDGAWAVGSYENGSGSVSGALIEHWDGSAWTVTDTPVEPSAGFFGVATTPSGRVWAVGSFMEQGVQETLTLRCVCGASPARGPVRRFISPQRMIAAAPMRQSWSSRSSNKASDQQDANGEPDGPSFPGRRSGNPQEAVAAAIVPCRIGCERGPGGGQAPATVGARARSRESSKDRRDEALVEPRLQQLLARARGDLGGRDHHGGRGRDRRRYRREQLGAPLDLQRDRTDHHVAVHCTRERALVPRPPRAEGIPDRRHSPCDKRAERCPRRSAQPDSSEVDCQLGSSSKLLEITNRTMTGPPRSMTAMSSLPRL